MLFRSLFKHPLKLPVPLILFHRALSVIGTPLSLSTNHCSSGHIAACQASAASQNSQHRLPAPCACGVLHRLAGLPSLPHIEALHLWGTVLGKGVHWLGSIWLSVLRLPAHPLAAPKCHTPSPCEPPVLRRSAHLSWCSTNASTLGKLA